MGIPIDEPTLAAGEDPDGVRELTVIGQNGFLTYPLPESGTISVGRGDEVDVRIDDVRISRRHLLVHLTGEITVEDLGSANGTFVGGQRLSAGARAPLAPGEAVHVGAHILIVKPARPDDADNNNDDADERRRILDALAACGGNQSRAARLLGIGRGTLVARLDAYQVPRPRKDLTSD